MQFRSLAIVSLSSLEIGYKHNSTIIIIAE